MAADKPRTCSKCGGRIGWWRRLRGWQMCSNCHWYLANYGD